MCSAENQIQGFLHTGKYSTTAFQPRPCFIFDVSGAVYVI